jgi:hypothetical protein
MRSPRVLISAWKNIVLDFVVKLLSSKKALIGVIYNSILVVINRLTKYAHFIFYKKGLTTEELIYAFNRNIIVNHRISKEIINNRDKLFTSKFWKLLMD